MYTKFIPFLVLIGLTMPSNKINELSLEDILDNPSVIVLQVKKQDPFSVETREKIGAESDSTPDFVHYTHHYRVEEVLYNGREVKIEKGQNIAIRGAEYRILLGCHKKYYLENIDRRPLIPRYENRLDIMTIDRAIIFLNYKDRDALLEYVVRGAYESIGEKEKILHILSKSKN